ncbi:MAG: hypothetical protein JRJ77_05790 [Deltaproteobacteria bacterium]|nr:hypothetical protein [Deltaproteobacteria bacterium]MBW2340083.1 hypothetical protein [Deltaproteobacteria bacterium]
MDINDVSSVYHRKLVSPKNLGKGNGFTEILEQRLAEANPTNLQSARGINADFLKQSDKVLNLLDDYGRQLADPTKTLKDIEPLVESIKQEVGIIESEVSDQFHNDKHLERFIKDLAVTANVAMFKFHRGDYV